MSAVADHVLLWVTTYLLHSTLLLGLTAFLVRFAWLRRPERTEVLWRTALLAGALTATAHVLVGAPVWTTRSLVAVTPPVARVPSPKREVATTTGLSKPVSGRVPALLPSETPPLGAPVPPAATTRVESPDARWLLLVWPLVAGVLLLRLVRQRRALRRVGVRSPVEDDHAAVLATLAREAGIRRRVRLTRTTSMSSPITLGTWRPEICLPERALESLPPAQLRAMLAHEVAHVARHDDLWLRLTSAVASLLFFQPLNHVATRRLRDAGRGPLRRVGGTEW